MPYSTATAINPNAAARSRVLAKHPHARCRRSYADPSTFAVIVPEPAGERWIGQGPGEAEAWSDAEARLATSPGAGRRG